MNNPSWTGHGMKAAAQWAPMRAGEWTRRAGMYHYACPDSGAAENSAAAGEDRNLRRQESSGDQSGRGSDRGPGGAVLHSLDKLSDNLQVTIDK